MILTTLPKTAATWEMNAETIKMLCEMYNVDPKTITNPAYKDQPWEKKYPKYMTLITGLAPCPICNGPQKLVDETTLKDIRVFKIFQPTTHCLSHPYHTLAITTCLRWIRKQVKLGKLTVPGAGKDFPHGNWNWIESLKDLPDTEVFRFLVKRNLAAQLGDICKHELFLADCDVCIEELRQAHLIQERIDEVAAKAAMAEIADVLEVE